MVARLALLSCLIVAPLACRSLPPFGAEMGKQEVGGAMQRPTYTTLRSFFGYVVPGAEPDEVRDDKKLHYVYVWVPGVTPELGVRMLSPAKSYALPKEGDLVDAAFLANRGSDVYFDPWIRFERCVTAANPEDIVKPCANWVIFGDNDDADELPAQPNGNRGNALVRVRSSTDDPTHALVRGVYRVAFTTNKPGEVQGSYLLQVGAPLELHGLIIAGTPAELAQAIGDKGVVAPGQPIAPVHTVVP
ncbi:MAG: hypothetical protein EOO40_05570 [Deltaproteobacteria bacterium]|nr:MAG: hypothetical protein EOO40_05570 [Deltaproteobacteria bacterium]